MARVVGGLGADESEVTVRPEAGALSGGRVMEMVAVKAAADSRREVTCMAAGRVVAAATAAPSGLGVLAAALPLRLRAGVEREGASSPERVPGGGGCAAGALVAAAVVAAAGVLLASMEQRF